MINIGLIGEPLPNSLVRKKSRLTYFVMAALPLIGLESGDAFANGEIDFVAGKAQIISAGGEAHEASKGARVVPGDALVTGADGEIHIVMDDNGLVAVRPNSRMKIEDYVADGNDKDHAIMSLFRGQMRSITGWIGKIAPKNYAIRTPSGTIGIRGTDHEVAVVEGGADAGTYDKVNTGETVLQTPKGDVGIKPGKAGFSEKAGTKAPSLLEKIPPFYKPSAHETLIDKSKERLDAVTDKRLKDKQEEERRHGGRTAEGDPKISDACNRDSEAMAAFNEYIRAYEQGNVALIQSKLDPAMIGYQNYLDGVIQDTNRMKQLRLTLRDTEIQCGPDVTVIQTAWDKRFLDVTTFTPTLNSGRATILLHRSGSKEWRMAGLSGDNPFTARDGTMGQLNFGPVLSLSKVSSTPSTQAINIEVIDGDLAGIGALTVQIVSNQGDNETVSLPEVSPGRFMRSSYMMSSGKALPHDNVLELETGAVLTLRYVDQKPGNNRPATLWTKSLATIGAPFVPPPTVLVTAPSPFSFAKPPSQSANTLVTSNTITITGNTAPAPVVISGGSYSINGAAFTNAPGTITAGQTIAVQLMSSAVPGGTSSLTITIGGVQGTFAVTTEVPVDTMPDPFTLISPTQFPAPGTNVNSPAITITGINAPTPVDIIGGSYMITGTPVLTSVRASINNARRRAAITDVFTNAPGTIENGQKITVQVTSSPIDGGVVTATLNVGGVTQPFTVTTRDITPNPFSFISGTSTNIGGICSTATSNKVTISGINSPTPIMISGVSPLASYSINGTSFTNLPGTVKNGDTVQVRANGRGPGVTTTVSEPRAQLGVGSFTQYFFVDTCI